ncbi:MAG: hypothetical protein EGQ82_00235 [Clostridiales bacterium]|nr:hypothetical protein [Clostridiales bacterium]
MLMIPLFLPGFKTPGILLLAQARTLVKQRRHFDENGRNAALSHGKLSAYRHHLYAKNADSLDFPVCICYNIRVLFANAMI